ncbi:MAG: hypothetical protein ACR2NY_00185 [Alphaproteobacteria bacterium]
MSLQAFLDTLPQDPTFWVAVSFIIFFILAFVKGRQALINMLDNNIQKVKKELADAEQIKKDAEKFYQDADKKLQDASQLADDILKSNQESVKKLLLDADEKLQKKLLQKEKQLENRINQDRIKLKDQIVKEIANEAIIEAQQTINDELQNDKTHDQLLNQTIKKLGGLQ